MDQPRAETNVNEQQGYGELLSGLLKDVQELLRGEVRLAKAEIREEVGTLTRGIAMLAGAAMLSIVGLTVLMIGVGILVNDWIEEQWQALALVGAATLVVAILLALLGKNRLSAANLAPQRTIESLKEDKQWASQQVRSLRN